MACDLFVPGTERKGDGWPTVKYFENRFISQYFVFLKTP